MKALKLIAALVIGAAIIWLVLSHQQELARQRTIVDSVRPLLSACNTVGDARPIMIRGKALVWDMASSRPSGAYDRLPEELKASASDGTITVFMVLGARNVQVGTYSVSGQPAYRQYTDLCVVYWPERTVTGAASVVSQDPRSSRPVQQQPEYGDPNEPIARWIAGLPRGRVAINEKRID